MLQIYVQLLNTRMLFYLSLVILVNLSLTLSNVPHHRVVKRAVTEKECKTPIQTPGICIPGTYCPYLFDLEQEYGNDPSTKNFLRRSRSSCNNSSENGEPVICCINRTTKKQDTREYGISNRTSDMRIVGGKDSILGDWPWMVALGYRSKYRRTDLQFKCGATLISNEWVITAAHCIADLKHFQLTIARLGELDLDSNVTDGAKPEDILIEKIIIHPEFTNVPQPVTHDIALLRLQKSVNFTPHIQPIRLLSGDEPRLNTFYNRRRPFILGWGSVEWHGPRASRLQEATLAMVNNDECAERYAQQQAIIDDKVLCAGEKGKDACQGDSGGPLIFFVRNRYFLGGVVSFGIRCADLSYPGVYTRIAAFADWISETTGLQLD